MFRLFGLLLVGFVLAGCQTGSYLNDYQTQLWSLNKKATDDPNYQIMLRPTHKLSNDDVCRLATSSQSGNLSQSKWRVADYYQKYVQEAKRRGLSCGVGVASETQIASSVKDTKRPNIRIGTTIALGNQGTIIGYVSDNVGVAEVTVDGAKVSVSASGHFTSKVYVPAMGKTFTVLAKDYSGLTSSRSVALKPFESKSTLTRLLSEYDKGICERAVSDDGNWHPNDNIYVQEAKRRGLSCGVENTPAKGNIDLASQTDDAICSKLLAPPSGSLGALYDKVVLKEWKAEAKRRGLTCALDGTSTTQIASSTNTQPNTPTSAELTASQKEAERLRQELAALKTQQEQQQKTISNDTQIPLITIASADTKGKQGVIRGRASDNVGVAEVTIDGNAVAVQSNGSFEYSTFVPATGLTVTVQATDMAGLSSMQTVSLQRNVNLASAAISFDRLNPIGRPALKNKDAIALIIGIGSYENIIDAAYADKDALMFRDYAAEKLGIPESRIKTLINEDAEIGELLLGIRKWIRRATKPEKTDVYIFYAGHGIATASGEAYILPYDGRPEVDLLDRTALLQKELFAELEKANPRNVTIFLDACYTGKARTGELLMADANYRPIAIRPIDDGMPDNFTLITASSGDEFSGPLEEVKHGLFSYFLMKGMEGDADSNQDSRITAGELHQFVKENVLRQSADKQTPELQGNANRVLVSFK